MNTIRFAVAALALSAAPLSFAVEATRTPVPTTSTASRSAVQNQAARASDADQLRTDEAYPRFSAPYKSTAKQNAVRGEAVAAMRTDRGFSDRDSSNSFVGGM